MSRFTRHIDTGRISLNTVIQQEIADFQRCRLIGIWRSPLARAVRERGPGKARTEQWHAFIAALPRSGVSQCEIDGSGVLDWLDFLNRPGHIPRQEVLDFLDEFGPKIHVLQERGWSIGRPYFFFEGPEHPNRFQSNTATDDTGGRFGLQIEPGGLFDPERAHGRWVVRFRHVNARQDALVLDAEDPATAAHFAHGFAWNECGVGHGPDGRYRNESLTGGNNYREILFAVPNVYPPFRARHFPVSNVLCHLRLTDREDEDGLRLLHIEEVQSDWHNQKAGYPDPPFRSQWLRIALQWCVQEALERELNGISLTRGWMHAHRYRHTQATNISEFYRVVENTLVSVARKAGATPEETSIHCRDFSCRASLHDDGWIIVDYKDDPLVRRVYPSREQAEEFINQETVNGLLDIPAVVFWEDPEPNWRPAFWRLEDTTKTVPETIPLPDPTAPQPSQEVTKLLDRLEDEINEAFTDVARDYFSAMVDSMLAFQFILTEQDLLAEETTKALTEAADRVLRTKSLGENRTWVTTEELQRLRSDVRAVRLRLQESDHGIWICGGHRTGRSND